MCSVTFSIPFMIFLLYFACWPLHYIVQQLSFAKRCHDGHTNIPHHHQKLVSCLFTSHNPIKHLYSSSISMLREHSDLFFPTDILTDIQQDLFHWCILGNCEVGSQQGGASAARFPVVIMTGLPSVFEQKGQLGPCQLPSRPLPLSVSVRQREQATGGARRGCCHANHFSTLNSMWQYTQHNNCHIFDAG